MSERPRLLLLQQIPSQFLPLLERTFELDYCDHQSVRTQHSLLAHIQDHPPSAILVTTRTKIDKQLLDACGDQLRAIATMSVGYDHIDVNECVKRNIRIGYTPGIIVRHFHNHHIVEAVSVKEDSLKNFWI